MEEHFPKELAALEAIFGFLERFFSTHAVDPAPAYALTLAVEEFFTNIVKYGGNTTGSVTINAVYAPHQVTIHIIDPDSNHFDPTQNHFGPDERPLEEKRIGGLGIHLTREMLDQVRYEYSGRTGTITLVKNLER